MPSCFCSDKAEDQRRHSTEVKCTLLALARKLHLKVHLALLSELETHSSPLQERPFLRFPLSAAIPLTKSHAHFQSDKAKSCAKQLYTKFS